MLERVTFPDGIAFSRDGDDGGFRENDELLHGVSERLIFEFPRSVLFAEPVSPARGSSAMPPTAPSSHRSNAASTARSRQLGGKSFFFRYFFIVLMNNVLVKFA